MSMAAAKAYRERITYGLPANEGATTLERIDVTVPDVIGDGGTALVPFYARGR